MMATIRETNVVVLAFALTMTALITQRAEAADRYALTCVANKTNTTISYDIKWGNGNWKNVRIGPARLRWHSWTYKRANSPKSPSLRIRFDADLRSGKTYWQTYKLKRHASPQQGDCNKYGKSYVFRYDGSRKEYIDLKVTN